MNRRILLTLIFALPFTLLAQVYKFNRQDIIAWETEHKSHIDTWRLPVTINVQNKIVVISRPPNGAGEKPYYDTLVIKNTDKERRDKRDVFTKIKAKDGRVLLIYGDDYITMCTKETKDHKRTEYVFYNQRPNE
jgi:hypothetical protein